MKREIAYAAGRVKELRPPAAARPEVASLTQSSLRLKKRSTGCLRILRLNNKGREF